MRIGRAALVLAVWAVGAIPALLGHARCMFAAILHRPCPGCGMTRAMRLLLAGDVSGSLRMHPFAVPVVLASAFLALASVWITLRQGSPFVMWSTRLGKAAIAIFAAVNVLVILFWILRAFGLFGGSVPVD